MKNDERAITTQRANLHCFTSFYQLKPQNVMERPNDFTNQSANRIRNSSFEMEMKMRQ